MIIEFLKEGSAVRALGVTSQQRRRIVPTLGKRDVSSRIFFQAVTSADVIGSPKTPCTSRYRLRVELREPFLPDIQCVDGDFACLLRLFAKKGVDEGA
jgi:hypothetical protein